MSRNPNRRALAHVHDGSPQPAAPRAALFSLRDLLGDGMLWAVPMHRRTVEKRLKRKYGPSEYKLKILTPKVHLRTCTTCGSDQEVGVLYPFPSRADTRQ
ncbi:large ribosomal subunit protein bL32m [Anopheles gambiae]|uniref:large ribosomal subunit protein bL32m n=1 Tax=Anopheles gambiae TaxID=7165 RepID=UPI002AC906C2|nr:large ribosomal subunit protein bL32m [Anopheles gambiae]